MNVHGGISRFLRSHSLLFGFLLLPGCGGGVLPSDIFNEDTEPPEVVLINPVENAKRVPLDTVLIATFSETIDATTINEGSFTLVVGTVAPEVVKVDPDEIVVLKPTPSKGKAGFSREGLPLLNGTVSLSNSTANPTAEFRPETALAPATTYTAIITTDVLDIGGNPLDGRFTWRFTTADVTDKIAPTVISTLPAKDEKGVATSTTVNVIFSEAMQGINAASFTLSAAGVPVSGDVTSSGAKATFMPKTHLAYSTRYTATITTDAKDSAGNPLATNFTWNFTTMPLPAAGAPSLRVAFGIKQLQFHWADVDGETFYKLMENPDGVSGFTQVGADIPAGTTSTTLTIPVHLHNWIHATYRLSACNTTGCIDSNEVTILGGMLQTIGYFKASNTTSLEAFGLAVSLSKNGNTLAVGAEWESSKATGIDGDQNDKIPFFQSGAVYLFTRTGEGWHQQAYIKASNTGGGDSFGGAVSLNGDGNTLAVGASGESSAATGINGIQNNDTATSSGAVYIFTREGTTWTQKAYIKASNTEAGDLFGGTVSLSSDGNTLAVGAEEEDDILPNSGAVYLFVRNAAMDWSQQAYIKAFNAGFGDLFGSVSISNDGNTLAVAAEGERSMGTGVNGGLQGNNFFPSAGAVYIFTRTGTVWSQEAYIKASNTAPLALFGVSISLSGDGNTLAVGSEEEGSAATGINGDQTDTNAPSAGAVYVFTRSGGGWSQQAYVKASNTEAFDFFGSAVSLSRDGNILAVTASQEDSFTTGINGNQLDNLASSSGAIFVFKRTGDIWGQKSYVKAGNTGGDDLFGASISMSGDGNTLAVGAVGDVSGESSASTGINGNQSYSCTSVPAYNCAYASGAVYLY